MATAYANIGGTGERRYIILVTFTANLLLGDPTTLIDGASANNLCLGNGEDQTGLYIRFEFPESVLIDEATWYQSATTAQGNWKWQGSNNAADWTDIGSSFALGGATTQTLTELNGNTAKYKYYQIIGVSGTTSSVPYLLEIEFKIGETAEASSYLTAYGYGNRTAWMTLTNSGSIMTGTMNNLINLTWNTTGLYWNSTTVANKWLKFDLGEGNALAFNEAILFQTKTTAQGNWKWQGSNNDADWTDIGGTFALGGMLKQVMTDLNGNTTEYRYYRLLGVSGSSSWTPYLIEIIFKVVLSEVADTYDDGTPDGGIVFGGEVVEIVTANYQDGTALGGVVFGGEETSADESHQVDGACIGGVVFGGENAELWVAEPNNWVAVKNGTYRISGVIYTLPVTMSYEGLGDIAALVNCAASPAVAGTYRYDLLSVDTTGAITVTAGAEATVPIMPTTPAGEVKLNHVLRYYGQTSIIQSDIGKIWLSPALATVEAVIADDQLAWAEMSTTITITCRDQYGQLFTGSKTVNATFESGNGTIAPLLRSGGGSAFVFTYTRGGNDPGDISPMLTFSSPTGALCVAFITLLDVGGSIMI